MLKVLRTALTLTVVLALGGCTVQQAATPSLTGPSEFALSIRVTATPDSLSLDGGSQSAIVVEAHDANGAPRVGLPVRLEILVGGTVQDCGQLSARNVVTGSDGRAVSVFTAPGMPLPSPACLGFSPGNTVTIRAIPSGNNFETAQAQSATIRMVPTGVIVPPADTPTPVFTFVPASPTAGSPVQFNASGSCGGQISGTTCLSGSQIVAYSWTFGDGGSGSGAIASHTYIAQQSYSVTLTVTNDRGVSASTTQTLTVGGPTVATTAGFNMSPSPAAVNQPVVFDASVSASGPGISIVDYAWNFGDGTSILHTSSKVVAHSYTTAGTYSISLTVTDSIGSNGSTVVATNTLTVNAVAGAGPTASFTVSQSPTTVGTTVTFDGGQSQGTVVRWEWDFGDGTVIGEADPVTTHAYSRAGSYIVRLTVTDTSGRQNSTNRTLNVQ
jgi:PKD repeat protein